MSLSPLSPKETRPVPFVADKILIPASPALSPFSITNSSALPSALAPLSLILMCKPPAVPKSGSPPIPTLSSPAFTCKRLATPLPSTLKSTSSESSLITTAVSVIVNWSSLEEDWSSIPATKPQVLMLF